MKYKGCICRSYLLQNAKTEVEVELFPCGRSMSFSTLNPLYTASMKRKKEPIWKRPNAGIPTIPALGLFAFSDSPILDEIFIPCKEPVPAPGRTAFWQQNAFL